MFDMSASANVWIPVRWEALIPGKDEGLAEVVENEIEIFIEILDRDELRAMFEDDNGEMKLETDLDAVKRFVRGWRRIVDKGNPVPFNDENLKRWLAIANVPTALSIAYLGACAGKVEIREKNSEGSPGDGQAATSNANRRQRRAAKAR